MMKPIDNLLDHITMYRLVLYYLIALVGIAVGLSLFGRLHYNAAAVAFSAGYITIICLITNKVFAHVFEAPVNVESVYITALISALIVTPYKIPHDILFLTAVSGLAISSKFILAIHKKHIFNPAAVAVALTALGPGQSASWWVGSSVMLPYVVIGGLLVARKIERGRMILGFLAAVAVSTTLISIFGHHALAASAQKSLLHSSLFFLAFVMLPEPLTSPSTHRKQVWYGVLAGFLFPPQIHIFSVYSTPELTLLVANAFSYIVSPKANILPRLVRKDMLTPNIADFIFKPEQPLDYKPGQYMEWTLPHKAADNRGNRRYFTLASSPTEPDLRLGVRFYARGSSFKEAMFRLDNHTLIAAGQLGGDFVLPEDPAQKLAFIAGGIGITPYRSMIKYLLDTGQQRDVALLYSEKSAGGFVYSDIFTAAAAKLNLKLTRTITGSQAPPGWKGHTGYINAAMIRHEIPDFADRLFYVSGPYSMVTTVRDGLHELGVKHHQIKTDYFPGYA